jgi:hypothetical protein
MLLQILKRKNLAKQIQSDIKLKLYLMKHKNFEKIYFKESQVSSIEKYCNISFIKFSSLECTGVPFPSFVRIRYRWRTIFIGATLL